MISACRMGVVETVKLLLERGAGVNTRIVGPHNRDGHSALMVAATRGDVAIVQALVDAGADVDARNEKHETAMLFAASNGHASVVQVLLQSGADWRSKNVWGYTPRMAASMNGHKEVTRMLRRHKRQRRHKGEDPLI